MHISKYTSKDNDTWNDFIRDSKNGTFLFNRNYMDYHSDRFTDFSLMFYDNHNNLIALLPANIKGTTLYSHGGLTYGGLVSSDKMTTPLMLEIFDCLAKTCSESGITKIIYKPVPHIYYTHPSEEDRYALFRNNAVLYRRDVSSVIKMDSILRYQERRVRNIKKAVRNGLTVRQSDDFREYWRILKENLESRHNVKPVHSVDEIIKLKNCFEDNIKLFGAYADDKMLAGVVIYETKTVAHAQYISSSEEGRVLGALDLIFDYLIAREYKNKYYFDFGISNEDNGKILNSGLIEQKEGFGARAVVYDFYELNI